MSIFYQIKATFFSFQPGVEDHPRWLPQKNALELKQATRLRLYQFDILPIFLSLIKNYRYKKAGAVS